jgi:hypothetical protein
MAGTTNRVAKFTSSADIGNSNINDNGSTITMLTHMSGTTAIFTGNVQIGGQAWATQGNLTDGGSIAWNLDTTPNSQVTLAGNRALANPTGMKAGGTYYLIIRQDATGNRTLTYGSAYKFANTTAPILTTTANAVDILTFISDGTNMYGVHTPNLG